MSEFTEKYKQFFQETEAGKVMLRDLDNLIAAKYREAEAAGTSMESFAHMKEAAGIREAVNRINLLMQEAKLPKT